MKVIAMPYAAGTTASFNVIRCGLSAPALLKVFEYSGHGQKMDRPLLDSIQEIAKEVLDELFPVNEPYCLLGYSMGGHVLCELYRLLKEKQYRLPEHVFLCAIDIPKQFPEDSTDLSDEAILKDLKELGGTPEEVLQDREFLEMLLPIYRADIRAENAFTMPLEPLFDCGGTVIVGEMELKEEQHFLDWKRFFHKPIRFHTIKKCGHFFIQEKPKEFAQIILATVLELKRQICQVQNR